MVVRITDSLKKAGIVLGIIFILTSLFVATRLGFVVNLDTSITSAFGKLNFGFGDIFMQTVTFLGSPLATIIYVIIIAALLYLASLRIPALWVLISYGTGLIIGYIVKYIIGRSRPVGHLSDGYSFPSGHALATWMVIAILFIIFIPNLATPKMQMWTGWGLIVFGLLLMESRLYLQDHYLTDVIAGASLGFSWIMLTTVLYDRYANVLRQKIRFFEYDEI